MVMDLKVVCRTLERLGATIITLTLSTLARQGSTSVHHLHQPQRHTPLQLNHSEARSVFSYPQALAVKRDLLLVSI